MLPGNKVGGCVWAYRAWKQSVLWSTVGYSGSNTSNLMFKQATPCSTTTAGCPMLATKLNTPVLASVYDNVEILAQSKLVVEDEL